MSLTIPFHYQNNFLKEQLSSGTTIVSCFRKGKMLCFFKALDQIVLMEKLAG